ncbi:MAG: dihydrodipicolinate synthase family protein [Geminicoccaceae bacterium]|nr:dihydrodipicolinate synthase family protein [Geminicoccaceae bacterium]
MSDLNAKRDLRGIVASLHTAFDEAGRVDLASLERLVHHAGEAGCCGVLATAVAGEVGSLAPDERSQILRTVRSSAGDRLRILAGVSAPDIATSAALAEEAAALGADMVMWQPPAGLQPLEIMDGVRSLGAHLPVMLQDLDWSGPGLDPALIGEMAAGIEALQAVKIETAPAGPKYSAVARATGGRLHLSGGWAAMQMPDALARGLDAFIPSGLLPVYVRIFNFWAKGHEGAARELFEEILPIIAFSNQHIHVSIRFWKLEHLMKAIFTTLHARPPVAELDEIQLAEAASLAKRAIALEQRWRTGSGS